MRYFNNRQQTASVTEPTSKSPDVAQPDTSDEATPVEAESVPPAEPADASHSGDQRGAEGKGDSSAPLETPIPPRDLTAEATADDTDRTEDSEELRRSFDSWLEATNQRDIERQMEFYNARLNRYYLARGASQEDVRAEKDRVFGRADNISIEAREPIVKLSPNGNQATIWFRKRYNIENEGVDRKGEVIQELRWQRVNGKWRIVGERDVRVVR